MKQKILTAVIAVCLVGGLGLVNAYFTPGPKSPKQEKKQEEKKEDLAKVHAETKEHQHTETCQHTPPQSAAQAGAAQAKKVPAMFKVKLETTKGDVLLEVHKDWAPLGAQRFFELVQADFFKDLRVFRMVPGFAAQFGISGDPNVTMKWFSQRIEDDPPGKQSNLKGYVSFAHAGPGTRGTQLFINLGDNVQLDSMGFPPFAKVIQGMDVVEKWNSQYGETPTQTQSQISMQGNAFLDRTFPGLDSITKATIVE